MTTIRPLALVAALSLLAAFCGRSATAQCSLSWSPGGPQPELSGTGRVSIPWDPDGAGPMPQRLAIGGSGLLAGSHLFQRLITWDGSQWETLGDGPGTFGGVNALTTWNGQLVAAGSFVVGSSCVALWNGTAWQPLGSHLETVTVLTVWGGNLVAGGYTTAGGVDTAFIRVWNGTAWSSLPTPPLLQRPEAMVSFQGLLCVGGWRQSPIQGVFERWNGTAWATSTTAVGSVIHCLATRSVSLVSWLYVGGDFSSIGGVAAANVAATSGGTFTWSPVGSGLSSACRALHVRGQSLTAFDLVACVEDNSVPVRRLNGSSWVPMGASTSLLSSLAYYDGAYHAATFWPSPDGTCKRFDGTSWAPVRAAGIDGEVRAATPVDDDVVLGGTFQTTADGAMGLVARWDGITFQPLGAGLAGTSVDALVTLDGGEVVAGGLFGAAVGGTANIARWNGNAWLPLGTGVDQQVRALCRMPNGDLVAGGAFTSAGGVPCSHIARWDGTTWAPLGTGLDDEVLALAIDAGGALIAGGAFSTAGGTTCSRIARWNGTAWLPLGAGMDGEVHALALHPGGDVIAVGAFSTADGVAADRCARWNGSAWVAMGTTPGGQVPVQAVLVLPNGDVLAGRGFHQPPVPYDDGLSRWNGSTWSGVGALASYSENVFARTITLRRNGELVVGGRFRAVEGLVSRNLARATTTCPAVATTYGTGCASGTGTLAIHAETLPWIGATFRTATTGGAPNALCLAVTGFGQVSIPLSALMAQGQPGCSLLASPDILDVAIGDAAGVTRTALALAPSPTLIGATFYQQTIPLTFDLTWALTAVHASDAVAATIGML